MSGARRVSAGWLAAAAVAGVALGAAGMKAARPTPPCPTCTTVPSTTTAKCPVQDDPKATDRLRRALKQGIFQPWTELGRAPTPAEFAARMKLSQPDAEGLLNQLQACGESVGGGILRAPESELIAVAWPFANLPTGITVTTTGGKPAFARCAIDALGVSEMMQTRTVVEATARDNGAPIRVVVDIDKVVSAEPPDVVVLKGRGCDNMSFFSSRAAAETWRKAHEPDATLFPLPEAVARGAKIFSRTSLGL